MVLAPRYVYVVSSFVRVVEELLVPCRVVCGEGVSTGHFEGTRMRSKDGEVVEGGLRDQDRV